ncbi:MAG: hypothetical protein M1838_003638 [Thelocarpon superellum]|nr:MAG: hypothetical protein M1838_003638 [Thelocarpon superellum]
MAAVTHQSSPEDGYFNDLSRNISNGTHSSDSQTGLGHFTDSPDAVPRPKRIACVVCRKRKLRCDGSKPSCGTCARLGHECAYDEVRRKSGPKRGYVKQLEARLAQVETLLKTQDPQDAPQDESGTAFLESAQTSMLSGTGFDDTSTSMQFTLAANEAVPDLMAGHDAFAATTQPGLDAMPMPSAMPDETTFTWEMIGLGIDEPLPAQDVTDELFQIYFDQIHPSVPMIHRRRFYAAMNLSPYMRPPVCLRYIMWCLAASVTDKYLGLQHHFYQRSRKYIEADEMRGHGESVITIAHSQTWTLISTYEFKQMYFPRAWLSTGRGVRLAQMMGLHRLDGVGLDVKQCIAPPRDWTEREERRRTFWLAFCEDRYASIGTGWPVTIDESDIMTNLPASDEAFDKSQTETTVSLKQAMTASGATSLSSFAAVVLMASLFGLNLIHLHRPDPNDNEDDLNGEFWRRHRRMDAILANTTLSLPNHLKLPAGINDTNIVFLNMNIHASTICLHQAAIFKANKNRLPGSVSTESKVRCVAAAAEIASTMRTVSHLDLSAMNPFISFCLYVSARVFIQFLKTRPEDEQARASLQFLLNAMQALTRKNPLTESFLVQLEVELEGTGIEIRHQYSKFSAYKRATLRVFDGDTSECTPIVQPSQAQAKAAQAALSASRVPDADVGIKRTPNPEGPYSFATPDSSVDLPSRQKMPCSRPAHAADPAKPYAPGQSVYLSQGSIFTEASPVNYDMDLTPDASTSTSSGGDHVGRPSPAASSHSTRGPTMRQSSYTPPNYDDLPSNAQTQAQAVPQASRGQSHLTQFMHANDFASLNGVSPPSFLPPTPGKESDHANPISSGVGSSTFVVPATWDMGSSGFTPGSNDGMFSQLMEMNMGWETGGPLGNPPGEPPHE